MGNVINYIAYRLGCSHPYRVSRLIVLLNWSIMNKTSKPFLKFRAEGFEAGFYIEGFKEYFEKKCFQKVEKKKCFKYICEPPVLPNEIKKVIDFLLEETSVLNDFELNRKVIRNKRYRELLEKGGF